MIIFAEWVGMRGKEPWERAVLVSDATTTQPRTSTRTNAGNYIGSSSQQSWIELICFQLTDYFQNTSKTSKYFRVQTNLSL